MPIAALTNLFPLDMRSINHILGVVRQHTRSDNYFISDLEYLIERSSSIRSENRFKAWTNALDPTKILCVAVQAFNGNELMIERLSHLLRLVLGPFSGCPLTGESERTSYRVEYILCFEYQRQRILCQLTLPLPNLLYTPLLQSPPSKSKAGANSKGVSQGKQL